MEKHPDRWVLTCRNGAGGRGWGHCTWSLPSNREFKVQVWVWQVLWGPCTGPEAGSGGWGRGVGHGKYRDGGRQVGLEGQDDKCAPLASLAVRD